MSEERLLSEIKDGITGTEPLTSILLKCQLLAYKVNHPILKDWVKNELNGYKDNDNIPKYRTVTAAKVQAKFVNFYGNEIVQDVVNGLNIPEPFLFNLYNAHFTNSVSELESFEMQYKNDPDFYLIHSLLASFFPVIEKCYYCNNETSYHVQQAWQIFQGQSATSILTAVKSNLLDFVCELGEILDCDLTKSDNLNEEVTNILYNTIYYGCTNIYNNGNNVAIGNIVSLVINEETKAKLTELCQQLYIVKPLIKDDAESFTESIEQLKQEINKEKPSPSNIYKLLKGIKYIIHKIKEVSFAYSIEKGIDLLLGI